MNVSAWRRFISRASWACARVCLLMVGACEANRRRTKKASDALRGEKKMTPEGGQSGGTARPSPSHAPPTPARPRSRGGRGEGDEEKAVRVLGSRHNRPPRGCSDAPNEAKPNAAFDPRAATSGRAQQTPESATPSALPETARGFGRDAVEATRRERFGLETRVRCNRERGLHETHHRGRRVGGEATASDVLKMGCSLTFGAQRPSASRDECGGLPNGPSSEGRGRRWELFMTKCSCITEWVDRGTKGTVQTSLQKKGQMRLGWKLKTDC